MKLFLLAFSLIPLLVSARLTTHTKVSGRELGVSDPDVTPHRILKKKEEKEEEASNFAVFGGSGSEGQITTTSSGDSCCISKDNRTFTLTTDERNNYNWVNEARKNNSLANLTLAADLVVEAKRWSRYLASKQTVVLRDCISRNIFCNTWYELGEYDKSSRNVTKSGWFTSMMSGGGRAYILYPPYNEFGIGISKNSSWFYVVALFKTKK